MQTTHKRKRILKVSSTSQTFPPSSPCPHSRSQLSQPPCPSNSPRTAPFPLSTAPLILLSPDLSASIPASRPAPLENQPRLFSSPSPVPFISFDQNRRHLPSLCHFPSSATILSLTDPQPQPRATSPSPSFPGQIFHLPPLSALSSFLLNQPPTRQVTGQPATASPPRSATWERKEEQTKKKKTDLKKKVRKNLNQLFLCFYEQNGLSGLSTGREADGLEREKKGFMFLGFFFVDLSFF